MTAKEFDILLRKHCVGTVEFEHEESDIVNLVVRPFKPFPALQRISIDGYGKTNNTDVYITDSLEDIILTNVIFYHQAWSIPSGEDGIRLFTEETIDDNCEAAIRMYVDPFSHQLRLLEELTKELTLLQIKFGEILREYGYRFWSNSVFLKESDDDTSETWITFVNSLGDEICFHQDLFTGKIVFYTPKTDYITISELSEDVLRERIEELNERANYRNQRC